jgi:hypothetical protein
VYATLDEMGVRFLVGSGRGAIVGGPGELVHIPECLDEDPRGITTVMFAGLGTSIHASAEDAVVGILNFLGLETRLSQFVGEQPIQDGLRSFRLVVILGVF